MSPEERSQRAQILALFDDLNHGDVVCGCVRQRYESGAKEGNFKPLRYQPCWVQCCVCMSPQEDELTDNEVNELKRHVLNEESRSRRVGSRYEYPSLAGYTAGVFCDMVIGDTTLSRKNLLDNVLVPDKHSTPMAEGGPRFYAAGLARISEDLPTGSKPSDVPTNTHWNWNDKIRAQDSGDPSGPEWHCIPQEYMTAGAIDLAQLGINGKLKATDATECHCCCGSAPRAVSKSEFIEIIMQAQAVMSTNMFYDIQDAYTKHERMEKRKNDSDA